MIVAIVPACGCSTRMGRPKLLLPIEGQPLIARVVSRLLEGGVDRVVAVVPPAMIEGGDALADVARGAGAHVIVAEGQTSDMRATIELALHWLERDIPRPDAVLLTPGDSPGVTAALVTRLIEVYRRENAAIVVPAFRGRRGHPLILSWDMALAVRGIAPGAGVNALVSEHAELVRIEPIDEPGAVDDLDTPQDYERWNS